MYIREKPVFAYFYVLQRNYVSRHFKNLTMELLFVMTSTRSVVNACFLVPSDTCYRDETPQHVLMTIAEIWTDAGVK